MKIQLLSDVHLEFYEKMPSLHKILTPSASILILAGDICLESDPKFVDFFEMLSPFFQTIIYVLGNHEYYKTSSDMFHSLAGISYSIKQKLKHLNNIYVLDNDYIEVGNIVFIGSTLWSYISKKDFTKPIRLLTNTNFIEYNTKVLLQPELTNREHLISKKWLDDILSIERFENKTKIVITHYLPSLQCIPEKYKFADLNKAFYSNSDELLKKADIWCAGHTHAGLSTVIEGTRVYINPLGYLWEDNNYKKDFTFETEEAYAPLI